MTRVVHPDRLTLNCCVYWVGVVPSLGVVLMKLSRVCEMHMLARTQTMGVKVSIRRTITPAKYTAEIAYSTTERWEEEHTDEQRSQNCCNNELVTWTCKSSKLIQSLQFFIWIGRLTSILLIMYSNEAIKVNNLIRNTTMPSGKKNLFLKWNLLNTWCSRAN